MSEPTCGSTGAHAPHDMPCDSGCQPDWHHDSCAIYGRCPGQSAPEPADQTCDHPSTTLVDDERGWKCYDCGEPLGWPADQTRADVVLTEVEPDALWSHLERCGWDRPHSIAEDVLTSDWLAAERAEHAAEVEALRRERDEAERLRALWFGENSRAQATVARVRALVDTWATEGWDYPAGAVYDLRAALDGER